MDVVYAVSTTHVTLASGQRLVVHKGQHWPASDPVVREQPSLFSRDPRFGMVYSVAPEGFDAPPDMTPVSEDDETETATAGPGERRNVRRRPAA